MQALESHYKRFLSSRVESRQFLSFWENALPEDVKPHPKPIDLSAGLPNEGFFPLESLHLNVVDEPFQLTPCDANSHKLHQGVPKTGSEFDEREFVTRKIDSGSMVDVWRYDPDAPSVIPLSRALQYTATRGMPPLIDFCKDFISYVNPPAYADWDLTLANGTSDSLFKIFETLCDQGEAVLVEEFTFAPTLSNIRAAGGVPVPVKLNISADPQVQGIDIGHLTELLDNWVQGPYAHLSRPKLLYTIPTGQNPTGMTLSREKRQQIYDLAEKHDFIIVEDDPYGYLKFPQYDPANPDYNPYESHTYSIDEYCHKVLSPSFITIDKSARVLRCETFSKVFSPGLRLSFVVGNKFLISKIIDFAEVSSRAPSGVSQMIVNNVIQKWAKDYRNPQEAWLTWVMKVAGQYTERRNKLVQALEATDAYRQGLFSLAQISAGMFLALKINFDMFQKVESDEERSHAMQLLYYKLIEEGVNTVLGINMTVSKEYSLHRSHFLRLTFAFAADSEQLKEASFS